MQHSNLKHQSQVLFWLYLSLLVHKNKGSPLSLKAKLFVELLLKGPHSFALIGILR
jgi:hypothetical protein